MSPELAEKLLKICRPYRPNMEHAICPGYICTTPELLKVHRIDPSEFTSEPPTIYDGRDSEVKMDGDEIVEKRDVYVFMKHGLEKLCNGKGNSHVR